MLKALKTAQWQTKSGHVVSLVEGETYSIEGIDADEMIEAGYAEEQKESKPVKADKEMKPVAENKSASKSKKV